ncbi:MAG: amylo-alpha-1,6-glucosidase [Bacteroidales bacterium]|jgi:predicted glycogen debranching enzyme|nr:amylo-alpha-1,6-glucosidase [Bacteroidales bacterium]
MSYLKFDKNQLVNLEYSLNREILRSNRGGSFCNTTIIGCNTRKYHGLLVSPVKRFENKRYVFLSSLDETVVQHNSEFNLGIHKYEGEIYEPKGHKYVVDFSADIVTSTLYRVGGVMLRKESLLVDQEEQILLRYTLEDAHSPTKLRFRPFLAFRGMHQLTKANHQANTHVEKIKNGVSIQMYPELPALYMQFSKAAEFVPVPDWYYGIEYPKEQERGYEYREDLFVPGYFEIDIKKGESIIFSGSLVEESPTTLKRRFATQLERRLPRSSYMHCLTNAAQQFVIRDDEEKTTEVIAGYPWFGVWGRDTFIALPGITLGIDDPKTCRQILDTMLKRMEGGLFPNMGTVQNPAFNSVDAPLWFFSAIQQYVSFTGANAAVWKHYGGTMKTILNNFRNGSLPFNIRMHDNGLIYAGEEGKALTWMDAVVNGVPVTPRMGYPVEVQALWYNAVMFALELAKEAEDKKFIKEWKDLPELIAASFVEKFWDEEKGYLADVVNGDEKDWSVRPNQVFATSLPYSPVNDEIKKSILDEVKTQLVTPRGLRTLSPEDPNYKGTYQGNQEERDKAYHQGTVWPWLLEGFSAGWLRIHKKSGVAYIDGLLHGFEEEMNQHGIGTISEVYNGDPPHLAKGAISQAWSVGALLMMFKMLEKYEA